VVLLRGVGYGLVRYARAHGLVSHRTLVLGAGRIGAQLVTALQERPAYGLDPIGFLDSHPLLTPDELPAPVLGPDEALASTIAAYGSRT
jgi:FlaA1/EpsC-like NDP-sugar epimerase